MAFVLALKCVSMAHSMSYADEDEDEDQALRRLSAEQNQCRGCDTTREEVQVDRNNIKDLFGLTTTLNELADTFGGFVNRISGRGRCSKYYGSTDGISWVYHATGRDCETAPEASRIKGAVKNRLDSMDGETICGMECLDLSKSRDWNGFLLIGPTNKFDYEMYCGPTLPLKTCSSGRKGLKDEL